MNTRAVLLGAAVVVGVGVPVATIGSVALDDGSNAAIPLALVVVASFAVGGWLAGDVLHGAIAALTGVVVAESVSILLQVVGDDDVNAAAVATTPLLAAALGAAGGWFAARRKETAV